MLSIGNQEKKSPEFNSFCFMWLNEYVEKTKFHMFVCHIIYVCRWGILLSALLLGEKKLKKWLWKGEHVHTCTKKQLLFQCVRHSLVFWLIGKVRVIYFDRWYFSDSWAFLVSTLYFLATQQAFFFPIWTVWTAGFRFYELNCLCARESKNANKFI